MISMTIELVTWGLYFGVGTLMLVLLLFTRHSLKKLDARKVKADRILQKHYVGKQVDHWQDNNYR